MHHHRFLIQSWFLIWCAEVDLHIKCTSHTEFTDKTMEAAKPIDLEALQKPASKAMDIDASGNGEPQGNSTIEGAINWLSEHQEHLDIDEMSLVTDVEPATSTHFVLEGVFNV